MVRRKKYGSDSVFLGDDQPDPLLSGILEMPPAPQYPLAFSSPQGFGDQSRDTHKKKNRNRLYGFFVQSTSFLVNKSNVNKNIQM